MDIEILLEETSTDPVYLHFKSGSKEGSSLVKAVIIEKKICGPKEPRKMIELTYQKDGKKQTFSFNYLKLLKMHEKGEL